MSKKSRPPARTELDELEVKLQQAPTTKPGISKLIKEASHTLTSTDLSNAKDHPVCKAVAVYITSEEVTNITTQDVRVAALLCFLHLQRLHHPTSLFDASVKSSFRQQLPSGLKLTGKSSESSQKSVVQVVQTLQQANLSKEILVSEEANDVSQLVGTLLDNLQHMGDGLKEEYQAALGKFLHQLFLEETFSPSALLDCIVPSLLQSGQRQSAAAAQFVQQFLKQHEQDLAAHLNAWLKGQLTSQNSKAKGNRQLPAILSQLLTCMEDATVDQLITSLDAKEGHERLLATQALLVFLAENGAALANTGTGSDGRRRSATSRSNILASHLQKRLCDGDVHVRAAVLENIQLLLSHTKSTFNQYKMLQTVKERVTDVSPVVRCAAVIIVAKLLADRHTMLRLVGLWHEFQMRLRDTDMTVRKQAVRSVVGLFHQTCNRLAEGEKPDDVDTDLFQTIPRMLALCLAVPDLRAGLFDGTLMPPEGMLLPTKLPSDIAADVWVRMHAACEDGVWDAVVKLLGVHCRFLIDVLGYAHLALKSVEGFDSKQLEYHLRKLQVVQKGIIQYLPDVASAQKGFDALSKMDDAILTNVQTGANPFVSREDNNAAAGQIKVLLAEQPVDGKVAVPLLAALLKRSAPRLFTITHMTALLERAQGSKKGEADAAAILASAGKASPVLLLGNANDVVDLVCKKGAQTDHYLRLLGAMAPVYRQLHRVLGSEHIPLVRKEGLKQLRQLSHEGPPKAGKACVLGLQGFSGSDAESDLSSLLEELLDLMDGESPKISTVLMALGKIAQLMPGKFAPHMQRFVDFIIKKHLPGAIDKLKKEAGRRTSSWGHFGPASMRVAFALKALVNALLPDVRSRENMAAAQDHNAHVKTALECLTSVLSELVAHEQQQHTDLAYVRTVAAIRVLRLMRRDDRLLLPNQYLELALVAQDPNPEARQQFVGKVWKMILQLMQGGITTQLIAKLAAILPLASMDNSQRVASFNHLQEFVVNHRTLMQQAASEGAQEAASGDAVLSHQPEFIIPYLVFLITHHPDFPEAGSPAKMYKAFVRALQFGLAPLLANKTGQLPSVTLGIILKMLRSIKQTVDSTDPECSDIMYEVCDIALAAARSVAKDLNKGKEMAHESYEGPVPLPKNLFNPLPKEDRTERKKDNSHLPSGLLIPRFKEPGAVKADKAGAGKSPKKGKKATPEAKGRPNPLQRATRAAAAAAREAMKADETSDSSEDEDDYSDDAEDDDDVQVSPAQQPHPVQPPNRKQSQSNPRQSKLRAGEDEGEGEDQEQEQEEEEEDVPKAKPAAKVCKSPRKAAALSSGDMEGPAKLKGGKRKAVDEVEEKEDVPKAKPTAKASKSPRKAAALSSGDMEGPSGPSKLKGGKRKAVDEVEEEEDVPKAKPNPKASKSPRKVAALSSGDVEGPEKLKGGKRKAVDEVEEEEDMPKDKPNAKASKSPRKVAGSTSGDMEGPAKLKGGKRKAVDEVEEEEDVPKAKPNAKVSKSPRKVAALSLGDMQGPSKLKGGKRKAVDEVEEEEDVPKDKSNAKAKVGTPSSAGQPRRGRSSGKGGPITADVTQHDAVQVEAGDCEGPAYEGADVPTQSEEAAGAEGSGPVSNGDDGLESESKGSPSEQRVTRMSMEGVRAGKENREANTEHGARMNGVKAGKGGKAQGKKTARQGAEDSKPSPAAGAKKRGRAAAEKQQDDMSVKKQRRGQSGAGKTSSDGPASGQAAGAALTERRRQPRRGA